MRTVIMSLTLVLAILLVPLQVSAQAESAQEKEQEADMQKSPQYVTGKELMTEQERAAMRQSMRAATSNEERMQLRAQNHAKMAIRAQERGLILRPSPNHQPGGAQHRQDGKGPGKRHAAAVTDADISGPQVWGAAKNVVKVKHLYFSEQPDAAGISEAKNAGVEVVINLRSPQEMDWDEAGAVTQEGLTYYQVPISGEGSSFDSGSMRRISELVQQHHGQPIWLHCSTGNRASAWLAIHLALDHHMNVDQSIVLARKSGLTKSDLETRVRTFLSTDAEH